RNLLHRHGFGRYDQVGLPVCSRLAFNNWQADVREVSETLFLTVYQQLEFVFGQILDVFPILVGNDGVHLHKLRGDAHHILPWPCRGRILPGILRLVGRRLLRKPGSGEAGEHRGGENKNDRSLKSEHGLLWMVLIPTIEKFFPVSNSPVGKPAGPENGRRANKHLLSILTLISSPCILLPFL